MDRDRLQRRSSKPSHHGYTLGSKGKRQVANSRGKRLRDTLDSESDSGVELETDKIFNAYVLSTAAAHYELVSSCLEEVDKDTLLHVLYKRCNDALLLISPDSACQSRKEAYYFAAVAKVAKALLDLLHADSNSSQRVLDLVLGSDRMADTKEETNSYTQALHMSANKVFWEMTTGDIDQIHCGSSSCREECDSRMMMQSAKCCSTACRRSLC